MSTTNTYKIEFSNETSESLLNIANRLCEKYQPSQLISVDADDFQRLMDGSKELRVIEAFGDTLEEAFSSVGPISADKAIILVNALEGNELTMEEMTTVTSYIATLPENIELCWGVGKTTAAKRQVVIAFRVAVAEV